MSSIEIPAHLYTTVARLVEQGHSVEDALAKAGFPGHTNIKKAHNHAEIGYTYTDNTRNSPALLEPAGGAVARHRRSLDMDNRSTPDSPGKGWSKGRQFAPRQRCERCGEPFYAPPSLRRRGGGRYCSRRCSSLASRGENSPHWKGPVEKTCLHCGASFSVWPSLAQRRLHCSRQCANNARRKPKTPKPPPPPPKGRNVVARTCEVCGAAFHAHRNDVDRGMGKFCTRECYYMFQSSNDHIKYTRAKGGIREDLGIYVRSSWEANWARYLNWLIEMGEIQSWEYEPDTFAFEKIKRGQRFYTPDFKVTNANGSVEYHEVKGYMDQPSRTKLKRMAKYYPDVKVIVIDEATYRDVKRKVGKGLEGWE